VWSVVAHPVVLGKTSRVVSADYPGVACRMIERYLPGSKAMFVLGAAGETQPWIATQEDPAQVDLVARPAASFAALLTQAVRPVADAGQPIRLACCAETVTIGKLHVDVTVWRIGSAWIVALPVELFGQLALDLCKRLDGPVLLATLANGWMQYWPTREAHAEGGYEVDTVPGGFEAGNGEQLIDRSGTRPSGRSTGALRCSVVVSVGSDGRWSSTAVLLVSPLVTNLQSARQWLLVGPGTVWAESAYRPSPVQRLSLRSKAGVVGLRSIRIPAPLRTGGRIRTYAPVSWSCVAVWG
jgi:hypothetical protein